MSNEAMRKISGKGGVSGRARAGRQEVTRGQNASKSKRSGSEASAGASSKPRSPTQEQIAERAKLIWQQRGCVPGQDERNWYEAEAQLKAEMAVN